jgi:hypothetical protein
MVGHTRATADTRRIRRLKMPQAVEAEVAADGAPVRLRLDGVWQDVSLTRRRWRIDQHWWRGEPVRRDYYCVATEDSPPLTVYHDLVGGEWFRQEYG